MTVGVQNTGVLRSAQDDLNPGGADLRRTAKLADGAHSFEAMMLEQMLKPLKFGESPGTEGDDGDASDAGGDTTRGMGTEALAKSIASAGGFGIARQIIRQVTAEDAASRKTGKEGKV